MCFIGVCVAEYLNEPLCVEALVRKPEEKEPSYLCSLPALPHTLSGPEEKGHSAARHGEGEPFSHSACGNLLHTGHAICI